MIRYTNTLSQICALLLITVSCSSTESKTAKNVILLIGDGMGLTQVSSSFYYSDETPNFSRFKKIGLINTSASSHKITDSAAGATAFASGKKSYNGAIGVNSDTVSIPTILEIAEKMNLSTGVVATSSITHATPASFYAHTKSRQMHEEIAKQFVAAEVDYAAGAGLPYFKDRDDGANYYDSLASDKVILDTLSLARFEEICDGCQYAYLDTAASMPRMLDGREDFLSNATKLGIDHLSRNEDGFFLMVEASQIDWGGHANDVEYLTTEVLDFDKVIGLVLDYAEKDGNTLVIVTADHETGGFALSSTLVEGENWSDYNKITGTFSTDGHTSTLIPVFAYGPGAEKFAGIYSNTEIFHKMIEASGW
ncbi:MAG: alkaline phosphatase [Cyclobacteriaceae bacterium]